MLKDSTTRSNFLSAGVKQWVIYLTVILEGCSRKIGGIPPQRKPTQCHTATFALHKVARTQWK
jgi:hypothetical protein